MLSRTREKKRYSPGGSITNKEGRKEGTKEGRREGGRKEGKKER